jgi:SAM-dependent methyltransferase
MKDEAEEEPAALTNSRFHFPSVPDRPGEPEWTGYGFRIGVESVPILSYHAGASGWTDDLTIFHEQLAGSSHFIDVASRRLAISQAAAHNAREAPVMLEVGCSSGFLLSSLRKAFPGAFVIGSDVVRGPLLALARRQPDVPLLHFDLTNCPLPDSSIDVVFLLNVLEHIESDDQAVRQLHRILKPGGLAIVEVPAGPELFDIYDELLMHHRRYRQRDLLRLFRMAGFDVLRRSHLGFFLYPGFYMVKKLRRRKRGDIPPEKIEALVANDIASTGGSPLFSALMRFELWLGQAVSYPFGIRCLLTARKPLFTE